MPCRITAANACAGATAVPAARAVALPAAVTRCRCRFCWRAYAFAFLRQRGPFSFAALVLCARRTHRAARHLPPLTPRAVALRLCRASAACAFVPAQRRARAAPARLPAPARCFRYAPAALPYTLPPFNARAVPRRRTQRLYCSFAHYRPRAALPPRAPFRHRTPPFYLQLLLYRCRLLPPPRFLYHAFSLGLTMFFATIRSYRGSSYFTPA